MIDRLRKKIASLIREELAYIDTFAMYPGTVYGSSRENDVDYLNVRLDNGVFGQGIDGVPLRTGIPGVTVEVPNGARVLVGFTSGKRSKPIAHLWERTVPIKLTIEAVDELTVDARTVKLGDGATLGVARTTDTVQAGPWAGTITGGSGKVKAAT